MRGLPVPPDNHVVRYVRPTEVDDGEVSAGAFMLRASETSLSVNWKEKLPGDRHEYLAPLRRLVRLRLARNGRFATVNVGQAKRFLLANHHPIGICSDPLEGTDDYPPDPSHSGITGLPARHDHSVAVFVGELIAECVQAPLEPARTD